MQSVVLDSCVLYSALLRDYFMRLSVRLFQPKWTEAIHVEWIRSVQENRPEISGEKLIHTRNLMNKNGRDCIVTDYESLIPRLMLPDPGDRHVLAAAIKSESSLIVTFNLSDFPDKTLEVYNIRAIHPDDFALKLFEDDHDTFLELTKRHRIGLINPPYCVEEYVNNLAKSGLIKTADVLRLRSENL